MKPESLAALGAVPLTDEQVAGILGKPLNERDTFIERIEEARAVLPKAVARMTQLVVDNPAQFAFAAAGSMVFAKILVNLVKPRTPLEALAVLVVAECATPFLLKGAIDRGYLKFRVRDADGNLVPLRLPVDPDGPLF